MKAALTTCLAALALAACAPTTSDIESSGVEGVDYSQYDSYAWVPLDKKAASEFSERDWKVRRAFEAEVDAILQRRGLEKIDPNGPDLFVYARGGRVPGYRATGATPVYEARYAPADEGAAWLAGTQPGSGSEGYLQPETLVGVRFLVSEAESDRVVWRGRGQVAVADARNDAMVQADARRVARELVGSFPPKN